MATDLTSRFPGGAAATLDELAADPHPLLARLRAAEPVSWLPVLDGWLVTRRDLALRVMRDPATFTVDDPRFSTAQIIGPSMLSLDGRPHTRHRDPFSRPFRPAQTRERFTAFVESTVDRLVAGLRPAGHAELRGELAGPLAVAVVAEALSLETAGGAAVDAATVRAWYERFVEAVSAITAGRALSEVRGAGDAYLALRAGVEAALAEGRPGALLTEAAAGPEGLTTDEVVSNSAVLMFGGIDTTEGMIANAARYLLGDPAQLDLVRRDPALLDGAIEESLRMEPSASVVDRYATADLDLAGAPIRKGDLVRVSLAGANRDPAAFPDPDAYDVRRGNAADHLAFAHGPHFCFGAHLARLETRTAMSALLARLPGLRLDPDRPAEAAGLVFRKPPELHVLWDR